MDLSGQFAPGPCQVCGGELRPYRHAWLKRCVRCSVLNADFEVAIPDTPGAQDIDQAMREDGLGAVRDRNNACLLRDLAALTPPGGRLLDVGCGPGFLLRAASARGFLTEGVEPDADVAPAAGALARVRHGYFPQVLGEDDRYDAIVFNDVLEHIPDLTGTLAAAHAHLEAGGVLALNCPDRRGLFFRVAALADRLGLSGAYDRMWQRGLPSPHLWYFTPANLTQAAAKAGFTPVGQLRLDTVALKGLWARIRCVRDQPLLVSMAAYAFAVLTWPVARIAPADAVVCFFRKG
jgi:SAM-dependent methyltransferase